MLIFSNFALNTELIVVESGLSTAAVACTSGGNTIHVYYYGKAATLSIQDKAVNLTTPTFTTDPLFSSITLRSYYRLWYLNYRIIKCYSC